jgi:hypothetical protein
MPIVADGHFGFVGAVLAKLSPQRELTLASGKRGKTAPESREGCRALEKMARMWH